MRFFEAKAYGLHDTGNPLFPRKDEPRSRRFWWILSAFMAFGCVLATFGALIYGPYLRVQSIVIVGAETQSPEDMTLKIEEQLLNKRWLILPNSHQWFFDTKAVEIMLPEYFPLKSVVAEKQGGVVTVTVVEDVFMVAFRSGDEVYLLDPTGKVLRVAEPAEKAAVLVKIGEVAPPAEGDGGLALLHADMPVIREKTATPHAVDDQIVDEDIIAGILAFSESLKSMGTTPKEFVSDDIALPWFAITSNRDYLILFDAAKSIDTQTAVLKTVTDEFLATQETPPRYVDVRFGTRVYLR